MAFKRTLRKAKKLPVVNSYNYENGQVGVWHSNGKERYKIVYENQEVISIQDLKDGETDFKPTASARRKVKVSIDDNMVTGWGFDGIHQPNSSLYIKDNLILLAKQTLLKGISEIPGLSEIVVLKNKVKSLEAIRVVWLCQHLQRFWCGQHGKHPEEVQKRLNTKDMMDSIKSDFHIS
ncbi:MAG: hypothetical protein UT66_C0056G0005 [candidate division CPR2 bacterium GW2011_GWC1_39_9]|nr:MAG: hypothetical protein UT66_C0056G0005 [candidate division CPR2 bacterium GW2011_GWC1_39_9]